MAERQGRDVALPGLLPCQLRADPDGRQLGAYALDEGVEVVAAGCLAVDQEGEVEHALLPGLQLGLGGVRALVGDLALPARPHVAVRGGVVRGLELRGLGGDGLHGLVLWQGVYVLDDLDAAGDVHQALQVAEAHVGHPLVDEERGVVAVADPQVVGVHAHGVRGDLVR